MPTRSLPPVTGVGTASVLKQNQQVLNQGTKLPPTPKAPWNFSATNSRGGIKLSWAPLTNNQQVDGYELCVSVSGDFQSNDAAVISLRDPLQSSYFDSLGGAPQTRYYKLRATAGTMSNPYAVHGTFTGVVKQTSIDASDTSTVPTTVFDTITSDITQKKTGAWKVGNNSPFGINKGVTS